MASTWRHSARLMERLLSDAQVYATTANKAHDGEAARAFDTYFRTMVGYGDPPEHAQEDEPLVANLVSACHQLAKACDGYADHIDAARKKILLDDANPLHVTMPWDSPIFGGNGDDGGLHNAVVSDPYIHRLGDVAHALDSARARVKLPGGGSGTPPSWFPPLLPHTPLLDPLPLELASFRTLAPESSGYDPAIPLQDPIPPDASTNPKLLTPAQQTQFRTWMSSLPPGGFAGGGNQTDPANAYQLRVSGYPEREVPLPPERVGRSGRGLMVDGLRPADGYAVEAKYVKKPNCANPTTYRSLNALDKTLGTPVKRDASGRLKFDPYRDAMYPNDGEEIIRYKAALAYPPNHELRGLEIVTNDKDAVAYWQSMMLMHGVTGTARYVP